MILLLCKAFYIAPAHLKRYSFACSTLLLAQQRARSDPSCTFRPELPPRLLI